MDLDRIEKYDRFGRNSHHQSETNIVVEKQEKIELSAKPLALHAALETGNLDLYKRAT